MRPSEQTNIQQGMPKEEGQPERAPGNAYIMILGHTTSSHASLRARANLVKRSHTGAGGLVVLHKSNASLICSTCPLQEQKNIEQGISNSEGNELRCQDRSPVDDEKESVRVSTGFRVFSRLFVATAQYPPSTFDIPCWIFCGSRPAADSANQAAQEAVQPGPPPPPISRSPRGPKA